MIRYMIVTLSCLMLIWGGLGCAPTQVASLTLSDGKYTVSLDTAPSEIWLTPPQSTLPNDHHGFGVVTVQVRDVQGRPVDGVRVEFQVDSAWAQDASVTPQHVLTRSGIARTVFEPTTTGVALIIVRIEDITQTVSFLVNNREGPGSSSGGPFGGGLPAPRSSYQ
jgi:hypothetical protein